MNPQTPYQAGQPQPGAQVINQLNSAPVGTPMSPLNQPEKPKKSSSSLAVIIILAVVAVIAAILAIYLALTRTAMVSSLQGELSSVNQQKSDLETQLNETKSTLFKTTEAQKYVFIGAWNQKIAIPEGLSNVSFSYAVNEDGSSTVRVTGTASSTESDDLPDFANLSIYPDALAAITRISKKADQSETESHLIFSDDDYNYYYSAAQALYSEDSAERSWEQSSLQLVQSMLTTTNNYSTI